MKNCSECKKLIKEGDMVCVCDACGEEFHVDCIYDHDQKHIPAYEVIESYQY